MSRRWWLQSNKLSVGLFTCVRRSLCVSVHASVGLFTCVSWSLYMCWLVSLHAASWSLYIPRALSTTIEMMPATTANEIAVLLKHFSIAESVCPMLRPSCALRTHDQKHTRYVYTHACIQMRMKARKKEVHVLCFAVCVCVLVLCLSCCLFS